jgi:sugar-specific transcriptional regulator TrmB/DNA-binding CsgD family transcriptional regulator
LLESIGLSSNDEGTYLLLLRDGASPVSGIMSGTGLTREQVMKTLRSLEELGLVARLPTKPASFDASRPDVALEALVLRRQEQLERIRAEAGRLLESYWLTRQRAGVSELVETITSPEAAGRLSQQIQRAAQTEIVGFAKPPFLVESNEGGEESLSRGVKTRSVYDRTALDYEWIREAMIRATGAGEEARVAAHVPMKFIVVDSQIAIVPMSSGRGPIAGALLVHPSPLLDALLALFEVFWERAIPFRAAARSQEAGGGDEITSSDRQLLMLLISGAKDEAIARELNITRRTVARRVEKLKKHVHATNRLQLAVRASAKGWI